jgi:hypothetical protein
MLVFAAGTMGWFLTRSRLAEGAALLLVAFVLFRPGFFWDRVHPPFESRPATEIHAVAEALPPGAFLRLGLEGETVTGAPASRAVVLPLGEAGSAEERLARAGLELARLGRAPDVRVVAVAFGSAAEKAGIRRGWRVASVSVAADRPAKEWMFAPALVLLAAVAAVQAGRRRRSAARPERGRKGEGHV